MQDFKVIRESKGLFKVVRISTGDIIRSGLSASKAAAHAQYQQQLLDMAHQFWEGI